MGQQLGHGQPQLSGTFGFEKRPLGHRQWLQRPGSCVISCSFIHMLSKGSCTFAGWCFRFLTEVQDLMLSGNESDMNLHRPPHVTKTIENLKTNWNRPYNLSVEFQLRLCKNPVEKHCSGKRNTKVTISLSFSQSTLSQQKSSSQRGSCLLVYKIPKPRSQQKVHCEARGSYTTSKWTFQQLARTC